ncbi:hypothetical protein P0Y35_08760 [Kiritimatiellaeota bacterium B1221]|nr:hypothetical protein [Kiritimatiellaeota bacterium B1221]
MKLPNIPPVNSPIKHSWARELILYLKSQQLHSSQTVRVSTAGSGGISLEAISKPQRRTAGSAALPPWWPSIVSVTAPSAELRVAFESGAINNVIPKIGSNPIGVAVDGELPYLVISSGTSGLVWAKCTTNSGGIVTAIVMDSGTVLPADTDDGGGGFVHIATHVYKTIAGEEEADPETVEVHPLWNQSLLLRRCGGVWIGA